MLREVSPLIILRTLLKGGAMHKQTPLSLFFVMILSLLPEHSISAQQKSNLDNLTQSLQTQYQRQLKATQQRRPINRVQQRPRGKSRQDIMREYQRYLNQSKSKPRHAQARRPPARPQARPPVRRIANPIVKPPIPDAEELFQAASSGNIAKISLLLQQGINLNVANDQKETAMHMAAARGHYSTVIFLINNGANPFARTVKRWIPLHHATRFRHTSIAHYLMKKGLSPHYRNSEGYSSIDMARTNRDQPLLNVFGAR